MHLYELLQENGFAAKEAKVYMAALELGTAPASSIARHCDENRVTTYTILKDLCTRGIASEMMKNNVKYYTVVDPKDLIEERRRKMIKLQDALPEFLALVHKGAKPKVSFYDGLDGLKVAFEDFLKTTNENEEVFVFVGDGKMDHLFRKYLDEDFIPLRKDHHIKIKSKMLIVKNRSEFSEKNRDLKDIVFVDEHLFGEWNHVALYHGNKIGLYMYNAEEMSALIIESKTFYS